MRRIMGVTVVAAMALVGSRTAPGRAEVGTSGLVAHPATIDFKTQRVGTESFKRTRITNRTGADVRLVVTGGLPDDFGFGLLPGQTCPVFAPGEVLTAGASCYAVVRFTPTEGFIGWQATGSLTVTGTDPATGAVVAEISVPVLGEAVSRI